MSAPTAFTPAPQQQVPVPNLSNLIAAKIQQALISTNCHAIGIIQSFNPALQTASVALALQRNVPTPNPAFDPSSNAATMVYIPTAYPLLTNVPVAVWGGGGCSLTFPIAIGDEGLVCFNDRNFDSWFANGTTATPPNTPRIHDLSDGIILVGVRSTPNALAGYSSADAVLQNTPKGSQLAIGTHIRVASSTASLFTLIQTMLAAQTLDDNAITGHPAAATIAAATAQLGNLLKV